MELLSDSILFFKNIVPSKLLNELDTYFDNCQIDEHLFEVNGTDETNAKIDLFLQKEIIPNILQYFLHLKHPKRDDLNDFSWSYYLDRELYNKTGKMEHFIERYMNIKVNTTCFRLVHRNNSTYDGNFIKYMGNMNNFTFILGLSKDNEHDSNLIFPIQSVNVKLNRGDILIVPAGITHPYGINYIVNGKFKFVETIQ
jgi:hypothetical protein